MKSFLLVGLGRFGSNVALELNRMGHEIMAVEKNEERVEKAMPYVTSAQIGNSTNETLLSSLDIKDFDVCIVAIGSDFQSSLETAALLKDLGAKLVVARASTESQARLLLRNGADEIIFPEKQLAKWAAIRYGSQNILDYVDFDGEFSIFEVMVPQKWIEHTVGQIDIRKKYNISIIAIRHDGKTDLGINSMTVFHENDTLMVVGKMEELRKCFHI